VGHRFTNETYSASKGAVTLLTKSVAVRHARDKIRCNSIHPATVDTPMVQELFKDPEKKRERLDELPRGRPLVVQCHTGARAAIAASLLHARGVADVYLYGGGFAEWRAAGYAVERETTSG
jgi:NAD(P)-dependent dehydrogenase (short-subunit alcohol dehydrogenase family)